MSGSNRGSPETPNFALEGEKVSTRGTFTYLEGPVPQTGLRLVRTWHEAERRARGGGGHGNTEGVEHERLERVRGCEPRAEDAAREAELARPVQDPGPPAIIRGGLHPRSNDVEQEVCHSD
jgi:hypothetical protein